MKKVIDWLHVHLKIIRWTNDILIVVIVTLFYILMLSASSGGLFKYHHEVTIVDELFCNSHSETCAVIGSIDGTNERFTIFDGYDSDRIFYQRCSLLFYTWHCDDRLYVIPDKGYEKPYDMVR